MENIITVVPSSLLSIIFEKYTRPVMGIIFLVYFIQFDENSARD